MQVHFIKSTRTLLSALHCGFTHQYICHVGVFQCIYRAFHIHVTPLKTAQNITLMIEDQHSWIPCYSVVGGYSLILRTQIGIKILTQRHIHLHQDKLISRIRTKISSIQYLATQLNASTTPV